MKDFETIKEKVMNGIENKVRYAYGKGYEHGYVDGKVYVDSVRNADTVCHCNLKKNADLIAEILDCDSNNEVFKFSMLKSDPKFKAGDEIIYKDGMGYENKAIVCDTDSDGVLWMINDNGCAFTIHKDSVRKTGKNYSQFEDMLEALRGEK